MVYLKFVSVFFFAISFLYAGGANFRNFDSCGGLVEIVGLNEQSPRWGIRSPRVPEQERILSQESERLAIENGLKFKIDLSSISVFKNNFLVGEILFAENLTAIDITTTHNSTRTRENLLIILRSKIRMKAFALLGNKLIEQNLNLLEAHIKNLNQWQAIRATILKSHTANDTIFFTSASHESPSFDQIYDRTLDALLKFEMPRFFDIDEFTLWQAFSMAFKDKNWISQLQRKITERSNGGLTFSPWIRSEKMEPSLEPKKYFKLSSQNKTLFLIFKANAKPFIVAE